MKIFKQKAFTLIELLVVIVIIGILATVSTATFEASKESGTGAVTTATVKELADHIQAFLTIEQFDDSITAQALVKKLGNHLSAQGFKAPKKAFVTPESCLGIPFSTNLKEFYVFGFASGQPNNIAIAGNNNAMSFFHKSDWIDPVIPFFPEATNDFSKEPFACVGSDVFFDASSFIYASNNPSAWGLHFLHRVNSPSDGSVFAVGTGSFPTFFDSNTGKICMTLGGTGRDDPNFADYCTDQSFVD